MFVLALEFRAREVTTLLTLNIYSRLHYEFGPPLSLLLSFSGSSPSSQLGAVCVRCGHG